MLENGAVTAKKVPEVTIVMKRIKLTLGTLQCAFLHFVLYERVPRRIVSDIPDRINRLGHVTLAPA